MANERINPLNEKWIVRDGSIFVERVLMHKADLGKNKYAVQQPVAFNVGKDVAEHLVRLHNEWYDTKGPGWVEAHNKWAYSVGSENWGR